MRPFFLTITLHVSLWLVQCQHSDAETYDVVIYGGTSGGVAAAMQTQRMGKQAILIEPSKHLGGLTSGGLGATDIGNKAAIGGISREFYRRIKKYYSDANHWKFERPNQYRSPRQVEGEDTMWTFEPHVAEKIMFEFLRESGATVLLNERIDLKNGVSKVGGRIQSVRLESGKIISGKYFIDASYEGDLMALAGARFHVGREANDVYGETLNGVQTRNAVHHQMARGVDPYVVSGDRASGLLPGVHGERPGAEGSGDRRVQTYNFRMCLTNHPDNRVPFAKPEGYVEARFELLFRNFEAGETRTPWSLILMPNRKTDINNNHGFSTDNIGMNYAWPEADHLTREKIFQEHLHYQQGLMWTLANHPRVPQKIRDEVSQWGLCRDEFVDNQGWPHQLYVREARRLISEYVMTQHNCQSRVTAEDSVGLAAYTMDSHNVQRYVDENGHVRNEGDVQVGGFSPYPISFRSIRPQASECTNLLVPVCLAASHIAYGSIRMEPVFMVLGQSAATAAVFACETNMPIQNVDYSRLKERLLADQQVLTWSGPKTTRADAVNPSSLPGLVLDDEQMERHGGWSVSQSIGGYIGSGYWHDGNQGQGEKSAQFFATLEQPGNYEVRLAYTASSNRATNVQVVVHTASGDSVKPINQREVPPIDKRFVSIGKFRFEAGKKVKVVTVSNSQANGYVVVDAIQLLRDQ